MTRDVRRAWSVIGLAAAASALRLTPRGATKASPPHGGRPCQGGSSDERRKAAHAHSGVGEPSEGSHLELQLCRPHHLHPLHPHHLALLLRLHQRQGGDGLSVRSLFHLLKAWTRFQSREEWPEIFGQESRKLFCSKFSKPGRPDCPFYCMNEFIGIRPLSDEIGLRQTTTKLDVWRFVKTRDQKGGSKGREV